MSGDNNRAIRRAGKQDAEEIAKLAGLLWPGHCFSELKAELESILQRDGDAVFICLHAGKPIGFAHCSIRNDYVEGAENSPTAYLESIFIKQECRGEGAAMSLLRQCEFWAAEMGCTEIASDCELGNLESAAFHSHAGFTEANRIVCYIKKLKA